MTATTQGPGSGTVTAAVTRPLSSLDDPGLPGLAALERAGRGTVLAHKAGRRATVLHEGPDGVRIEKLFSRREFDAALAVTLASSRHGRLAPALLAVDAERCMLSLEVVAGRALDRVDDHRRDVAVAALGPVVRAVHAAPTGGLPAWDPEHPGRKLRRWFEAAVEVMPTVATGAAWAVVRLGGPVPWGRSAPVCLHGDLSLRNVMHDSAVDEVRLVDWDRTCVGPAEVDLAPLVGLLGRGPFLDGYRAAAGPVDQSVLARLVLVNRLTRVLRRVHRGADGPDVAARRLAALLEEVAHRRL